MESRIDLLIKQIKKSLVGIDSTYDVLQLEVYAEEIVNSAMALAIEAKGMRKEHENK